jgi:hypothetical protein
MVKITNGLKPEQWSLIIKAAASHVKQKKVIDLSMAIDVDKTPSSDIEIVDGNFNSNLEVDLDNEDSNADGPWANSRSDINMENDSD